MSTVLAVLHQTAAVVRQAKPSVTARWVAAHRARLHAGRPVLPSGDADGELRLYRTFSRGFLLPGLRPTGMAIRTKFIDDEVLRALSTGVDQIVVVGAGYDGRALRFSRPGVRWYEVDHPATQPDKARRVREATDVAEPIRFVPVDLLHDDVRTALVAAGHDTNRRSLFICEGLFAYLPNQAVTTLCSRLRDLAASGSVLVASVLVVPAAPTSIAQASVDRILALLGERRVGIFHPGTAESLLADAGWTVCRHATSQSGRRSGRHLFLVASEVA